MYRILYFVALILIPVIFSWWLFIPMALLLVYLAGAPFELIFAGMILDAVYYFGEGIFMQNQLTIFSILTISLALFLNSRIHWYKTI